MHVVKYCAFSSMDRGLPAIYTPQHKFLYDRSQGHLCSLVGNKKYWMVKLCETDHMEYRLMFGIFDD